MDATIFQEVEWVPQKKDWFYARPPKFGTRGCAVRWCAVWWNLAGPDNITDDTILFHIWCCQYVISKEAATVALNCFCDCVCAESSWLLTCRLHMSVNLVACFRIALQISYLRSNTSIKSTSSCGKHSLSSTNSSSLSPPFKTCISSL